MPTNTSPSPVPSAGPRSAGSALRGALAALCLALVAPALAPQAAHATTFAPTTQEERIDAAELIVRGVIREVWAEEDASGMIWTRAQVDVQRVYKGKVNENTIIIEQLGGTYAGRTVRVDGVARFDVNEDVVLLLDRRKNGNLRTVGMTMGKFTVRLDPYSRREIVQQVQIPLERAYDHRFIPLPPEGERFALSDLEAKIQRRVEASK
jgi:hypothetical protein